MIIIYISKQVATYLNGSSLLVAATVSVHDSFGQRFILHRFAHYFVKNLFATGMLEHFKPWIAKGSDATTDHSFFSESKHSVSEVHNALRSHPPTI